MTNKDKLTLIAGPCVIESEAMAFETAQRLQEICKMTPEVDLVFKASFDKANRTSAGAFRGPGIDAGLKILESIRSKLNLSVTTDIHHPSEAKDAASVCSIIQIPAFLCRQTDLILAAADTKAIVNVKKGQFLAPTDIEYVIEKIHSRGNKNVIITERGTTFGYNNLVVDFRSFDILQSLPCLACFDATHAVQLPGANKGSSGGAKQFIKTLSKAAITSGVNILFTEVHPNPLNALSDQGTQLSLEEFAQLLPIWSKLHQFTKELSYASH